MDWGQYRTFGSKNWMPSEDRAALRHPISTRNGFGRPFVLRMNANTQRFGGIVTKAFLIMLFGRAFFSDSAILERKVMTW